MTLARPNPSPINSSESLAQRLLPVAVALSVGAATAIAGVSVYRLGFADSRVLQVGVLLFVLAGIWLPLAALAGRTSDATRALGLGIATAAGLWLPAAGLLLGPWAMVLCAGIVFAALTMSRRTWAQAAAARNMALPVALGLAGGVVLVLAGSAARYQMPEAIQLGLAHSDHYFHLAIAQMIAEFGVPSIGGDGLVPQRYHFGSHLVAAGLAKATASSPALVYVYWGTLALKLQLLWALACAGAWFSGRGRERPLVAGVLLYVAFYLAIGNTFLESESFMVGLALFIGSVPLVADLVGRKDVATPSYRLALGWLVALTFLCAVAKISVGFYGAVLLAWIAWRHRASVLQRGVIIAALAGLLGVTWKFLRPDELSLLDVGLNPLYYSYLQYMNVSTLVTFVAPALILAWALFDVRLSGGTTAGGVVDVRLTLRTAADRSVMVRRFLEVPGFEQVLGLCLLASVVVLFTVPVGSNVAFFTGLVLFLCACRVPDWFGRWSAAAPAWCRRHWFLCGGIVLLVTISTVSAFLKDFARHTAGLIRAEARQTIYWDQNELQQRNTPLVLDRMRQSLRENGTPFGGLQAQMLRTPWAGVTQAIAELRSQPGVVAVFVPPSNSAFWQRQKGGSPYWCMSAHLMIPAQLGVPMLRGIGTRVIEKECLPAGQIWYGFGKQQDTHRSIPLDDAKLCTLARQGGFAGIYVLEDIWIPARNRVLACEPGQKP